MVPQKESEFACRICDEAITNPICKECLEEEMTSWLSDREERLVPVAKIAKDTFVDTNTSRVNCIICKKFMEICPHCYTSEVLMGLKDHKSENIENFSRSFNYDIF